MTHEHDLSGLSREEIVSQFVEAAQRRIEENAIHDMLLEEYVSLLEQLEGRMNV